MPGGHRRARPTHSLTANRCGSRRASPSSRRRRSWRAHPRTRRRWVATTSRFVVKGERESAWVMVGGDDVMASDAARRLTSLALVHVRRDVTATSVGGGQCWCTRAEPACRRSPLMHTRNGAGGGLLTPHTCVPCVCGRHQVNTAL
jgi:hypothetical protein